MAQNEVYNPKLAKKIRREVRRAALEDIKRIHHNVIANRPWYLPQFIWGRIVAIVLNPERGQARE